MIRERTYDRRVFLSGVSLLAGCSRQTTLKVGWKSGAEQNLLADLAAQVVAAKLNVQVERIALGGTTEAHQSLLSSLVDLYPEYPSAAVSEVLRQDPPTDAGALLEICRSQYQPLQLEWLEPLGYETRTALVMLTDEVKAQNLTAASDLVFRDRAWRLGVIRDFQRRRDGFGALQKAYSLRLKEAPRVERDTAGLFASLVGKSVDIIAADTANGQLLDAKFTPLNDDRLAFATNRPSYVIRQDAETRYPGLRKALLSLSGKISTNTMRQLSHSVDVDKKASSDVAAAFLKTMAG